MSGLFAPITIRGHKIKNRIVMAPMVCFGYAGGDGKVTEKNIAHYRARARGGVGLIIIEATCVAKAGRLSPVQLGLWSDEHVEGFKKIGEACHKYGARVLVQIHHAGLAGHRAVSDNFISSSDFRGAIRGVPDAIARGMTLDEIEQIKSDFTAAALRAQKAGLEGVELHGAHGYLLSQFFSPSINQRKDAYGGRVENRARLALEIIQKIRRSAGDEFIIGCRMGCNEPGLAEGIEIARQLEAAGVDLLHISSGMNTVLNPNPQSDILVPKDFNYSWLVYGGSQIKRQVKVPLAVVGGIRIPQQAEYLVQNNLCDLVALGKGLLVDPEWANKARLESKVLTCIDCKMCAYFKPGAEPGEDCPRRKEKAKS
jgi:NADPH2 dehydrogenase